MLKIERKMLSMFLILSGILTLFTVALPVNAENETIVTPIDVGLYVDPSHASYSTISKMVKILEDCVLVMSNITTDTRYHIGSSKKDWANNSSKGSSCVSDILKSDSYTLSYVNSLFEAEEIEIVKDGYIKAENEENVYYVPIKATANETELTLGQKNSGVPTGKITSEGSIAGKSSVDMADVMTIGSTAISADGVLRLDYNIGSLGLASETTAPYNISNQPFTLETNIMLTGNAGAIISISASNYIKIDSDGYFWFDPGNSSGTSIGFTKSDIQISKNRWHKIALSWDVSRSRLLLFVDGKLATTTASYYGANMNKIYGNPLALRVRMLEGSVNSKVAVDDLCGYIGYYKNDDYLEKAVLPNNISLDTDNNIIIIFNEDDFDNVNAFNLAIKTAFGAKYAALFNSDLTTPSEKFDKSDIMVITSADGSFYDYYSITSPAIDETSPLFKVALITGTDGKIYARAPYAYNIAEEYTLCLAVYDGDILENLIVKSVGGENDGNTTEALVHDRTKTYKAFFWTNAIRPVCNTVSTKAVPVLKVLAIGNSFSDDAMSFLYQIAKSEGVNLSLANAYIGGCTVDIHYKKAQNGEKSYIYKHISDKTLGEWQNEESKSLEYCLTSEDWDIITVQQASGSSGREDTYSNLGALVEWINANKTNPNARLGWHFTWAYQSDSTHADFPYYSSNQMTMYNSIVNTVKSKVMPISEFDFIIPSGTTVQNLRTSFIGDTVTRDGYHMNTLGRYAVGLTWYKMITGNEIDDITYVPATSITDDKLNAIKESVNNALLVPYEVTQSEFN